MPNYYGLDVLEYECAVLQAHIQHYQDEISRLHFLKDLYDEDIYNTLVETNTTLAQSNRDKLAPISAKLEEYRSQHTPEDKYPDESPLEYLYQMYLNKHLPRLLNEIESAFDSNRNYLLSHEVAHFNFTARKIAVANLYHHQVDHIVSSRIAKSEIDELRAVPEGVQNASSAIEKKYRYFSERLNHCLDIGNKLRELSNA